MRFKRNLLADSVHNGIGAAGGGGGMSGGSIMSMFMPNARPMPQPQQAQQTQPPQHTQQQQNGAQAQGGGQVQQPQPNGGQQVMNTAANNATPPANSQGDGQGNPLDKFKDWFTMPANGQQQAQQLEALDAPLFTADPTKLQEVLAQQSFASVDPQAIQKVLSGDAGALNDILNSVARNVMQQAVMLTQNMTTSGITTYNNRLQQHLPNTFRSLTAKEQMAANSKMQHTAVQPVAEAMMKHIMQLNPTLPVAQATAQVEQFLAAMGSAFAPQQQLDPMNGAGGGGQNNAAQGMDWSRHFGR